MKFKSRDKQISVLDWFLVFSFIILILMVYIPQSVWSEENYYKSDRRNRMQIISQAEDFYYELTNEYTTDFGLLFTTVEAVMSAQISDSLFYGIEKKIKLPNNGVIQGGEYTVNVEKDFAIRVDTTFSISELKEETVIDTMYTIIETNELGLLDTFDVYIQNILKYENKDEFVKFIDADDDGVYDQKYKDRKEVFVNYLRRKFHLTDWDNNNIADDYLKLCPISKNNLNKEFIIEINNDPSKPNIKILSPITNDDKEWRYGIFRYNPGKQEFIENGVKSWAGK